MNIYLNIFKAFYQTQNENFIKKFKIEECLNNTPSGYYLDNSDEIYKKCFETCKYCYGKGD